MVGRNSALGLVLLEEAQDHRTHDAAGGQRHDVHQRVIHDGEDEDAAVGSAQGTAEGHGQRTGQGRADDAAGQDAERVGGGDIKLLAAIGAWLGLEGVIYTILLSCLIFGLYSAVRRQRAGAFGPSLSVSAIIILLWLF